MFQKYFIGKSIAVYPDEQVQGLDLSCLSVISVNEKINLISYMQVQKQNKKIAHLGKQCLNIITYIHELICKNFESHTNFQYSAQKYYT